MEYVEITLGGAVRRLALDANAMIAMHELTGQDITTQFVELAKPSDSGYTGKLKGMRNMLWALSASACPEFALDPGRTVQQVGAWFGLPDVPGIVEALTKLMSGLEMPKEFPEQMAPFVPSPLPVVEAMVRLAELKDGHHVVDLGAGDGRLLFRAVEVAGVKATGYELHPERFGALHKRIEYHSAFLRLHCRNADIRNADLATFIGQPAAADAVFLYLLPVSNAELKDKLLRECQPGCRIISHDFAMPEWEPETVELVQCEDRQHTVYRWIVPERGDAAGTNG